MQKGVFACEHYRSIFFPSIHHMNGCISGHVENCPLRLSATRYSCLLVSASRVHLHGEYAIFSISKLCKKMLHMKNIVDILSVNEIAP
jgi:hypothetical protein